MDHAVFQCQYCRCKINLTGNFEQLVEAKGAGKQAAALQASVFDGSKIDESFIVLDDKRSGQGQGNKSLEESFVVLGSASLLRPGHAGSGGSGGSHSSETAVGLDAKLQALAQIFEIASTATHVDHPVCLDCAAQLKDEIEAQVQETEREIAAYSSAVARLEAEQQQPLEPDAFQREMGKAWREEEDARQQVAALEAELAAAQAELAALQPAAAQVDALEAQYWHDFNAYQLQLRLHVEERDALLSKIDRASQRLQLLKSTNVFNDAFKIWHDGPFGTISGFRLGRTPEVAVDWDEINAAWGQAVLLLHTMAQACKLTFSAYRLLPMGSHPRVSHKGTTYDLFGPVNKLWSANYDRAMVCYLACLKEFGDFAASRDQLEGKSPAFELPFPIEGDKVGQQSIKLTLNKDTRWTKALKFMLADLKWVLQWMVKYEASAEMPALHNLGPEGPAAPGASGV